MMQWIVLLLITLGAGAQVVDQVEFTSELNHGEAQIEWIRSRGGFFSPKLSLRRVVQTDPNSTVGIFTTENISQGETVMIIPRSCLLTPTPPLIATPPGGEDMCDTVRHLIQEYDKKEKSEFWPYVNYVFDPRHRGILPSSWSDEGKRLLETILGKGLPRELPVAESITSLTFQEICHGSGDPFEEEAYLAVIRLSWDDTMVPLFDMCNHRNRPWKNVDSNSVHEGKDITVYATRDIKAGEQLYLSDNECEDCNVFHTSIVPSLLRDYGFVEQYPQRWLFLGDARHSDLVFELDDGKKPGDDTPATAAENQEQLKLTWLSQRPNTGQIHILHGYLRRLRDLHKYVSEQAERLGSSHERDTILRFYNALTTALEHGVYDVGTYEEGDIDEQEVCTIPEDISPTSTIKCSSFPCRKYDELEQRPAGLIAFNHREVCDIPLDFYEPHWDYMYGKNYEIIDHVQSFYQDIKFTHNDETNDTCLYLNDGLHACTSLRPHYHEVLVHYPTKFLKEDPKRVICIGGGDNMALHEILKYEKSLEFVVMLELDQTVVRKSFQNFGIKPHWENDKVHWWYGDAAKSLLVLPREYYGTFDIVVVDIETFIRDNLKLNDGSGLTFMDAALMLMRPDGIIIANQDYGFNPEHTKNWTDYTIDLYYDDIPITCQQGLTMGSNTIDFLDPQNIPRKSPEHVEILYMHPIEEKEYRFDGWYNYRKNKVTAKKYCKEPGADEQKVDATSQETSAAGVVMILEAENVLLPLDSPASVQAAVTNALKDAGLTGSSVNVPSLEGKKIAGDAMVFLLKEGYVVARAWPEHKYCAFDVMLWSSYHKLLTAKAELIAAVGGKSSSSYRIVTGGMFGVDNWEQERRNVGPHVTDLCEHPVNAVRNDSAKQSSMDAVLRESFAMIQDAANAVVVVLCGEQDTRPCSTLEALTRKDSAVGEKVVPVWTCPEVTNLKGPEDTCEHMLACESYTLRRLRETVDAGGKINGIMIDPNVPRAMGQVLHKILSSTGVRRNLLAENYVVTKLSLNASESVSWPRVLLDRFQTDFAKYDPAYRAEIFFNDTSSSLELGVFSTGDRSFYSHLVDVISRIENEAGLVSDVQYVRNGINNYVPHLEHRKVFTNDDFDHQSALDQWFSQKPLGRQSIIQLDVKKEVQSISPLSSTQLKDVLQSTLLSMNYNDMNIAEYNDVGDGCVIVVLWSTGNAVLVWDGRTHVNINTFTLEQSEEHYDIGMTFIEHIPFLEATAHDEQPRGFGKVVNFKQDVGSRDSIPRWAAQVGGSKVD